MDHPLTWHQFQNATARQIAADCACTVADARECLPGYWNEWWRGVEAYVKAGGTLSARFLNTLADDPRHYRHVQIAAVSAGNNQAFPRGYVMPHCRPAAV